MDKLQLAGRDFPVRLVAKHWLRGAARVLRALADELDGFVGSPPSLVERRVATAQRSGSKISVKDSEP